MVAVAFISATDTVRSVLKDIDTVVLMGTIPGMLRWIRPPWLTADPMQ